MSSELPLVLVAVQGRHELRLATVACTVFVSLTPTKCLRWLTTLQLPLVLLTCHCPCADLPEHMHNLRMTTLAEVK